MSDEERMAAVLAEHQLGIWDPFSPSCSCGQWRDKRDDGTGLAAHVAAELARAGFGAVEAARNEASRLRGDLDVAVKAHRRIAAARHRAQRDAAFWEEQFDNERDELVRAEAALASARAEALREAAELLHFVARLTKEQTLKGRPHDPLDRLLIVERVIRNRADQTERA